MEAAARVTPGSSDPGRSLARTVDEAGSAAHGSIENAAGAAHPIVDRAALAAHEGVAQIANAVDQATQSVGVKGAQLKSFQLRAMDRWRSYVRARPLATLGVAAAAAYLLSRLLRAR